MKKFYLFMMLVLASSFSVFAEEVSSTFTTELTPSSERADQETCRVYLTKDYAKSIVIKDEDGLVINHSDAGVDGSGDTYYDYSLTINAKYSIDVTPKEGYYLKDIDTNFIGKILNNEFIFEALNLGYSTHILVNLEGKKMEVKFPTFEHGSVDRKGWHKPVHRIKFGKVIKLDVEPEEGYELESLTIGGVDVSKTLQFTVGLDNTIVAKFRKKSESFTVTATATGKGSESNLQLEGLTDGKIEKGGKVKLIAAQGTNDSFLIKDIKVNGVHLEGDYLLKKSYETELTITENTAIEVEFFFAPMVKIEGGEEYSELENATVSLSNSISAGTKDNYLIYPNKEVAVTVTPDAGYELESLTLAWMDEEFNEHTKDITATKSFAVKDGVSDPTIMMPESYSLRVKLKKAAEQFTVTATATGKGSASNVRLEGLNDGKIEKDGKVKLIAEQGANDTFVIKDIKVNGVHLEGDYLLKKSYETELTITENTAIEVEFFFAPMVSIEGDIAFSELENASVQLTNTIGAGTENNYLAYPNKEVKVTVVPEAGYELESITLVWLDENYNEVEKDITATKTFSVKGGVSDPNLYVNESYTLRVKLVNKVVITIPEVQNGTLTLEGVNSGDKVAIGEEIVMNVTPAEGYELESITVGGQDVTEAKKFIVGEDNTIVVKFKAVTAVEALDAQLKLYPNPATDYAVITGLASGEYVKLISLTGKTVLVEQADLVGQVRLELTKLPRGLYIVRAGNKVFKLQLR